MIQTRDDQRSFPDAADGRPVPPMAAELWAAGLSVDDANFAAVQLRQSGYYLVRADDVGWPEIMAFNEELRNGQGIREDGGGFMVRCIMALFGRRSDPVETYQQAATRLLAQAEAETITEREL